jgi:tRNA (cytidine56-2'-O)-methyltransferase
LVARALGAQGVYVAGSHDPSLVSSIQRVIETWGGAFWVEFVSNPLSLLKDWKKAGGQVAHLTMYGLPLKAVYTQLDSAADILVVIGGEKVPWQYYQYSDFNIAVGSQPHSEVAALALFLDRLSGGSWESITFNNARAMIIPSSRGKTVKQFD